jgi:hypothetical protein
MNNTRTLAIAAILAATIVAGITFATTTQSAFAVRRGNGNDDGNTVTAQIDAQKASVSGHDNNLNQEAQNVICTHPSAPCTQEGTQTPPPPPKDDGGDDKDPHDSDKNKDDQTRDW